MLCGYCKLSGFLASLENKKSEIVIKGYRAFFEIDTLFVVIVGHAAKIRAKKHRKIIQYGNHCAVFCTIFQP